MLNVFYDASGNILAYNQGATGNPGDVPGSTMVSFPDGTDIFGAGGQVAASVNTATQALEGS